MGKRIAGRVALVTGASRGIGRAIAMELAKDGAAVAVMARSQADLKRLAAELEGLGHPAMAIACDVSDLEKLESSIGKVAGRLGRIDILVNNAGIYKAEAVRKHTLDTWKAVMDTNLTSALVATTCVLKGMIGNNWGRVINLSSISGKVGEAFGSAYSASKFGLIGLTQSLALEVAKNGITVNAVCPGWVKTDMAIQQLTDEKWCKLNEVDRKDSLDIARLSVPQMRFIEPEEVASLVNYLCSHEARGITGQAINICGGLSLH